MIIWGILLFIVIFIALLIGSPSGKGAIGEILVSSQADRLGEEYILLNNCTIPNGRGGTTQIDHILISSYGVFVIETKNYRGEISGGKYQKQWTKKLNNRSSPFPNPLHQNYGHIKALEKILADIVSVEYLYSLIVFTPNSTFKTEMPENVCNGAEWLDFVKKYQQEVIPRMKLKRIHYRLSKEILEKSWKTHQEHINYVKTQYPKNKVND